MKLRDKMLTIGTYSRLAWTNCLTGGTLLLSILGYHFFASLAKICLKPFKERIVASNCGSQKTKITNS